ncbi:hypothetical protein CLV41_10520 [Roseibium marinum]|uniref:Uncharacterized protein n=1 Tax=Roseibium marinum TaxID=281252 RepID=A0A2S3USZ7_9HYPH|nr:hypothetical protein CLV41_10520 [Roseibium marinum]
MGTETACHVEGIDEVGLTLDRQSDHSVVACEDGERQIESGRAVSRKGKEAVDPEMSSEIEGDAFTFHAWFLSGRSLIAPLFLANAQKMTSALFVSRICPNV